MSEELRCVIVTVTMMSSLLWTTFLEVQDVDLYKEGIYMLQDYQAKCENVGGVK